MGRVRALRLATALTVALIASPRRAAADFVVRTSSLKIRDPEPLRGAYESAIGDVSPLAPFPTAHQPPCFMEDV